jgi:hypothetical protein
MAEGEIPNKLSHAIRLGIFWIALPAAGIVVEIERDFEEHGNRYQVIGCLVGALLSIVVVVYWDRLIPRRRRPSTSPALKYLR